jgi:hypothetical protein
MQNVNEELLKIRDILSSTLQRVNDVLETVAKLADDPVAENISDVRTVDPEDQEVLPVDSEEKPVKARARKRKKKKNGKLTDSQRVIRMIKRAPNGLDVNTIKRRTKFNDKKISNIVHRAYKSGKINRVGRGLYTRP